MRNIQKKGWFTWGIVILTILLNIAIVKAATNNPGLSWLLIVSIMLLVMTLYVALKASRFFHYFNSSFRSFPRQVRFELISQSISLPEIVTENLRIVIGSDQCSKPYNSSLLTIETRGIIHQTRIVLQAVNQEKPGIRSAMKGGVDTFNFSTDASIGKTDPAYYDFSIENGRFNSPAFKRLACMPDVKMIEIKLTPVRNIKHSFYASLAIVKSIESKSACNVFYDFGNTTFPNAEGLAHFIESLRKLSGEKPVGIRLSITDKKEFREICYAIRKTQIIPDFFVITGSSGEEAINHTDLFFQAEMSLNEALLFVSQTLQSYGLDKRVKVIASGKISSGFDILKLLALGANAVYADSACFDIPEFDNEFKIESPNSGDNIHYRLMSELERIMNGSGFRNVSDVTLSSFFSQLDIRDSKKQSQPKDQVMFNGSLKKMHYKNRKELEPLDRRSKEKILLH